MLLLILTAGNKLLSQTAGNLDFSVTTTSSGGFSPSHLIAIWIENGSSSFIKTKIKYGTSDNYDHLSTWTSKSSLNIVDATSGSTLTNHGTRSLIWDGTNVSGNIVADGTYKVWVEMAWSHSNPGKTVTSYTFEKGSTLYTSNPANTENLLSVSLTWTPSISTSIEDGIQDKDIRAFPNPTTGLLNIDFKHAVSECNVQVINDAGIQVYIERFTDVQVGIKTLDLSSLSAGAYFIALHMPGKDVSFRIIRIK
jgi:hypothetical protein